MLVIPYKQLLIIFLLITLTSCSKNNRLQLTGSTMGTTYHITIVTDNQQLDTKQLQNDIDQGLAEINQQMSTYIDNSEISRFNQYAQGDWFPISNELLTVIRSAVKAHTISNGAFDPSIYPLVSLWGFAKPIKVSPPSESEIQAALRTMGLNHLKIRFSPPALAKDIPQLSLDLSAIAKGYGVDALANLLKQKGFQNYLVEIGGEIYAAGSNPNQEAWRIAVEQPDSDILMQSPTSIQGLSLSNQAVATSGNYRNYYEYEGQRYAHTLDPTTGRPAHNSLASVTVIHPSTMWADAMATTIMVMGVKKGLAFANQQKLPVFMVIHAGTTYKTQSNRYFSVLQK